MALTENFNRLSEQLTNYPEVELIYFGITENKNGMHTINYNMVCNIDNIADFDKTKKLLETFIATVEILRARYANPHSKVNIEYRIITANEFDELINDQEASQELGLEDANIIYSDNELYTSMINTKRKIKK